jgi:acyl carrier protein
MFEKKESQISESKKAEILLKIKPIIASQLQIKEDRINLAAKFREDLGADSLDAIEIVMDLEEAFNLEIPDADSEKMNTVEDTVIYLAQKYKNKLSKVN